MTEWHTTPEGREALSRAHSAEAVLVLKLSDGHFALYNHAKPLQMIITHEQFVELLGAWPPFARKPSPIDLKDLGIL